MHVTLSQHLFISSIRANEFFDLAALTFIKRMLRICKHVLKFLDALLHTVEPHYLEFQFQLFCVHAVQLCSFGMHFRQACHAVQCLPFLLQRHNDLTNSADFFSRGFLLLCLIVGYSFVELLHRVEPRDILRSLQTGKGLVPLFLQVAKRIYLLLYFHAFGVRGRLELFRIKGNFVIQLLIGLYLVKTQCHVRTVLERRSKRVQTLDFAVDTRQFLIAGFLAQLLLILQLCIYLL